MFAWFKDISMSQKYPVGSFQNSVASLPLEKHWACLSLSTAFNRQFKFLFHLGLLPVCKQFLDVLYMKKDTCMDSTSIHLWPSIKVTKLFARFWCGTLMSKHEFCENWRSESHIVLKGVYQDVLMFSSFVSDWINLEQGVSIQIYWVIMSFKKIDTVKPHFT